MKNQRFLQGITSFLVGLGCYAAILPMAPAEAVELQDGNSTVQIGTDDLSTDGWLVDGTEQIFSPFGELYFFQFGDDPNSAEIPLQNFELLSLDQTSENELTALFTFDDLINVQFDLLLIGSEEGSGSSTINQTITITNISEETLDFSLFTYMDFDVAGTYQDDSIEIDGNTVTQQDPSGQTVTVTASEIPDHVQAAPYPQILAELYDDSATTLNDTRTLLNQDGTVALQFDQTLMAGNSFVLSFEKQISYPAPQAVPEPGTVLALAIAGGCTLFARRGGLEAKR